MIEALASVVPTANLQWSLKLQQNGLAQENLAGLRAETTDLSLGQIDRFAWPATPNCASRTWWHGVRRIGIGLFLPVLFATHGWAHNLNSAKHRGTI